MKNLIALIILGGGALAASAETAVTIRAADLQSQARADAGTVAKLPENTKVDVVRRLGAWNEVKTSTGQTGWINMFNLKIEGGGAAAGSSDSSAALGKLLSSGRKSNDATVGTAVKGLTKEDLQNANADPAEFKKMQGYSVNKSAAQSFAQRSRLTPAKVEYLAEPAPVRTESTTVGG